MLAGEGVEAGSAPSFDKRNGLETMEADCTAVEGYLDAVEAGIASARPALLRTLSKMDLNAASDCIRQVILPKDSGLALRLLATLIRDQNAAAPPPPFERNEDLYGEFDPEAGF